MLIEFDASRLSAFGDSKDSVFCLITSRELAGIFVVNPGPNYSKSEILTFDGNMDFGHFVVDQVPLNSHVLTVLPNAYVRSPSPAELGPQRKLAVMACASTPTSVEAIAHFLAMGERSDPEEENRRADAFFTRGQETESLSFTDDRFGTVATFRHLEESLVWHEQAGSLGWGEQQLFPSGEVSVLSVSVFGQDIDRTLDIEGEIALCGAAILHSGTPSFLPEDQQRIYQELTTLADHAVILELKDGRVTSVHETSRAAAPAARMLEKMMDVDSRYAILLEIGFGINSTIELFPGNTAMNEVYGGRSGAVHFGLGLTPYTQYHLDVICPHIKVLGTEGQVLFGAGS